jgi:hypothetical protein
MQDTKANAALLGVEPDPVEPLFAADELVAMVGETLATDGTFEPPPQPAANRAIPARHTASTTPQPTRRKPIPSGNQTSLKRL